MHTFRRRRFIPLFASVLLCLACLGKLCGCALVDKPDETRAAIDAAEPATVRVLIDGMQGQTAFGLVDFLDKAAADGFHNQYHCVTSFSAASLIESFQTGSVDIAVVPTSSALSVYQVIPDDTCVISIAALGRLHVVSPRKDIRALEDLVGTTVILTGAGSMNEYAVRALLAKKGLSDQVTLQFVGDASDVAAALASDDMAVGILDEPYATTARFRKGRLRSRVDLADEWAQEFGEETPYPCTVAIARTAFATEHPEVIAEFIEAQSSSVAAYDDDPDTVAQLLADTGFVDSLEVAEAVLPTCGMTCQTGEEMHETLASFLQALYDIDPAWVCGGQGLPQESFYYTWVLA